MVREWDGDQGDMHSGADGREEEEEEEGEEMVYHVL